MKAWFTVPGREGAVLELRDAPAFAGEIVALGEGVSRNMPSDAQTGKIVLTLGAES